MGNWRKNFREAEWACRYSCLEFLDCGGFVGSWRLKRAD
jgi:hypothetical protein